MENDLPTIKKKLKDMIQKINLLKQTTILKNSTFDPILETVYSNEKGCDLFISEVQEQKVLPSKYIKPITEFRVNSDINKLIVSINNKINKLDEKFINSKTLKDIQIFVNFLNTLKRNLNKLKFVLFNSIYTNVQKGGGGLEESERDLDEVIIINTHIVEKLETIATLCEQITQKLLSESSSFDCLSLSTKMNRDIENFLHYKSLFKTVSDMIADPAHEAVLSDVIKESWFIQISTIIKSRTWEHIDLTDENIQNWKSEKCKDVLSMSTDYANFLKLVPILISLDFVF